ncbi:MAG: L-gulono,4-lactone dehydrogenase, partial [Thermoleophilia bacterium]|nr:L-gulono,4-lactone dehydrogenase [Thermoleophilia bacterium]
MTSPAIAPSTPRPGIAAPSAPVSAPPAPGVVVNDIHSKLNETVMRRVEQVHSTEDVQRAVRDAAREGLPVAIAGGRHSMGGQQFVTDGVLIDTRAMNQPVSFDPVRGTVTVQAGIEWPELMKYLDDEPRNHVDDAAGTDHVWGIRQKQTGADRLSIGGAIASNIHGRGLHMRPFIDDVESMRVVDADGAAKTVSRTENADLFRRVVGGYGLFGVVTEATLRLARRHQVERTVSVTDIDHVMGDLDTRMAKGAEYGDFQFAIDPKSPDFLVKGVLSTYAPVADPAPIPADQKHISDEGWKQLMLLAHTDKSKGFDVYAKYYTSTTGQRYWSDSHQMANYTDDYHLGVDKATGA